MAIKVPFVADVSGFLRGTSNMEDALEDVSDALDDLGRNTSTERVEDDLEAIGKAADASAEKLESSFSGAFDTLKAEGRTASRSTKEDLDDVGSKGSETLREFSSEAKQNVAETVSSFDGSASSAVDAIQGTFGGLVSALGPAGVVGAAVVGVGIGLARNLFERSKEAAAEFQERVADLTSVMNELGSTRLDASSVNQTIKDWSESAEEGTNKLLELKEAAIRAGLDPARYIRAMAGDQEALAGITAEITARQEQLAAATVGVGVAAQATQGYLHGYGQTAREVTTTWGASTTAVDAQTAALHSQQRALKDSTGDLDSVKRSLGDAATVSDLYRSATEGTADATEKSAAALAQENEELATNARLKGDAAEAGWNMADALEAVTVKSDGGKASLDANTRAGRDNAREVLNAIEAINAWGDAQIDAKADVERTNAKLKEQEDALVRRIAPAFAGSERKARDYIRTLGGIPKRKDTEVKVSDNGTVKRTQERIDNIRSSGVPVPIEPDLPSRAKLQADIDRYYSRLSIKVPVALDQYRSGKSVDI